MRDMSDENEIQRLLTACVSGDPKHLESALHPDFAGFGVEDGLYIRADRSIYARFMTRQSRGAATKSRVEWIDVRNRIATGCIVQDDGQAKKISVLTLLLGTDGWRVMSATFSGEEGGLSIAAPQARLQ